MKGDNLNPRPIEEAKSPELRASYPALVRAAQRAREIAANTGTALVVNRNGIIEYLSPHTPEYENQADTERMTEMNLHEAIAVHARALPVNLQRETLDFIAYLEQRYHLKSPAEALSTETFLARFAGCLGDDFPDDIDCSNLPDDTPRESFE